MAIEDNQKGQEAQRPTTPSVPLQGGGGSGPVSGIGGMSPAERVSYIQELQRMSPLNKISDAVKKLTDNAFGLSRQAYDQAAALYKGVQGQYTDLRKKDTRFGLNQHISGLTMNVRGKEQLLHEKDMQANVDLPNGRLMEKKQGGVYVESDWTPQSKGKVE